MTLVAGNSWSDTSSCAELSHIVLHAFDIIALDVLRTRESGRMTRKEFLHFQAVRNRQDRMFRLRAVTSPSYHLLFDEEN